MEPYGLNQLDHGHRTLKFFHKDIIKYFLYLHIIASEAERSEASPQSEDSLRKAREPSVGIGEKNKRISRKRSIFDMWCIEQKMFVSNP